MFNDVSGYFVEKSQKRVVTKGGFLTLTRGNVF